MKYVLLTFLSMGIMMPVVAQQGGEKTQEGKILTMDCGLNHVPFNGRETGMY